MQNQLTNFDFNSNTIRVVEIDGNPWFVGADVLYVLYGKAAGMGNVYAPLEADERTKVKRSHLGMIPGRDVWLISESGLYKLIMRSDKPEARAFQNWVTQVVLPSIRKDGGSPDDCRGNTGAGSPYNQGVLNYCTLLRQRRNEKLLPIVYTSGITSS